DLDRLVPRYGREGGQEIVEAVSRLEEVDQVADGDPGTYENRGSLEDFRIAMDHPLGIRHAPGSPIAGLGLAGLFGARKVAGGVLSESAQPGDQAEENPGNNCR